MVGHPRARWRGFVETWRLGRAETRLRAGAFGCLGCGQGNSCYAASAITKSASLIGVWKRGDGSAAGKVSFTINLRPWRLRRR